MNPKPNKEQQQNIEKSQGQRNQKAVNSQDGKRENGGENKEEGKQIQDFFITNKTIGRGAFGQVFYSYKIAKDGQKTGKYAAKVIQLTNLNDKEVVQLTREIEILKKIKHDNIVKMEHVTRTKNNLYLFLEFIKDGDLRAYIEKKKFLSQEETLFFFRQISNGFKELYKNNIIHRDIKPENILLEKQNQFRRALISDFGFARVLSQDQMNTQIEQTPVGSLKYMAPQILSIINFSCKCDVWSLGVMIYEFLYGQTPWTDDSYQRLLNKIQKHPLVFPNNINVSPQLKELLRKMMTIDEEQRISWDELFLHPLLNDNPEFYSKFAETDQYITNSMKEIYSGVDLQQAKVSIKKNPNEDQLYELQVKVCEYLSYQRKLMIFITSTINDVIKFYTYSSYQVSKIVYHKTLLSLQKQQQIIREDIQALLNGEQVSSKEEFLQPSQLEKLKNSDCFKYFSALKQQDDDYVMPFFIQLFTNSAKYLEQNQEEEFLKILKQKLLFSDDVFKQNHESVLGQFIIEVMNSINKKQNKYSQIIQFIAFVITCRQYQNNLLWKPNVQNQNKHFCSMQNDIRAADIKQLETQANEYYNNISQSENSPLKDSIENSLTSSVDKLQVSQEQKINSSSSSSISTHTKQP